MKQRTIAESTNERSLVRHSFKDVISSMCPREGEKDGGAGVLLTSVNHKKPNLPRQSRTSEHHPGPEREVV